MKIGVWKLKIKVDNSIQHFVKNVRSLWLIMVVILVGATAIFLIHRLLIFDNSPVLESQLQGGFSDLSDLAYFHFNDKNLTLYRHSFQDNRPYVLASDTLNEVYVGDINWFAWAMSPDKKTLIYYLNPSVENSEGRLMKVDIENNRKEILRRDTDNYHYRQCLYSLDGKDLYCLKNKDTQTNFTWWSETDLWRINLETLEEEKIEEDVSTLLGWMSQKLIYSKSGIEDKNNIFSMDILNEYKINKITLPSNWNLLVDKIFEGDLFLFEETKNSLGKINLLNDFSEVSVFLEGKKENGYQYIINQNLIFWGSSNFNNGKYDSGIKIFDYKDDPFWLLENEFKKDNSSSIMPLVYIPLITSVDGKSLIYELRINTAPTPPIYQSKGYKINLINIQNKKEITISEFYDPERIKIIDWL